MRDDTTLERHSTKTKPLTEADKREAFIRAMTSFSDAKLRWQERAETGLNDGDLREAVGFELGISGGSGSRDGMSICYQGAGLKIWASLDGINMYEQAPLFQGNQTIAMARQVFAIPNPDDKQMSLF